MGDPVIKFELTGNLFSATSSNHLQFMKTVLHTTTLLLSSAPQEWWWRVNTKIKYTHRRKTLEVKKQMLSFFLGWHKSYWIGSSELENFRSCSHCLIWISRNGAGKMKVVGIILTTLPTNWWLVYKIIGASPICLICLKVWRG